jgi:hypothetical protein
VGAILSNSDDLAYELATFLAANFYRSHKEKAKQICMTVWLLDPLGKSCWYVL